MSDGHLLELLWPDRAPNDPTASLQVAVSRLRTALGGRDTIVRELGYRLALDPDDIDRWRWDGHCRRAQDLIERGEHAAAVDQLRAGEGLWHGPALSELADHPTLAATADGLDAQRAAMQIRRLTLELDHGDRAEAARAAEEALRATPDDEALVALVMRARHLSGFRSAALDLAREFRARRRSRYGTEPGQAVRDLEALILRHDAGTGQRPDDAATGRSLPAPLAHLRTPVIGRRRPIAALRRAIEDGLEAPGGLRVTVVVAGSGVGKTSLVAAALGGVDAAAVLPFARCEPGLANPLGPIAGITRALLDAVTADDLATHLELHGPVLSAFGRHPRLPNPPTTVEPSRTDLSDALVDLLVGVARRRPVVVVVDDLQWISLPTRQFLRHLARESIDVAATIVATSRPPVAGSAGAELLADLAREPGLTEVALDTLSRDALGELVRLVGGVGGDEADQWAEQLDRATQGNAYLARLLLEQGRTGHETSSPLAARLVVGQRLSALSPAARQLVTDAARFDASLHPQVASALAQADPAETMAEIAASGLLVVRDDRWHFEHDLGRRLVLEVTDDQPGDPGPSLDLARRVDAALGTGPWSPDVAALTWAATEPGDLDVLVRHADETVAELQRSLAADQAQVVAERLADHPALSPPARCRALLQASHNARRLSDPVSVERLGRLALDTALAVEDPGLVAGALEAIALYHDTLTGRDELADVLRTALGKPTEPATRCRLLLALANTITFHGGRAEAERASEEARQLAATLVPPDPLLEWRALLARSYSLWGSPAARRRRVVVDDLVAAARRLGHEHELAESWRTGLTALLADGDRDGYEAALDEMQAASIGTRSVFNLAYTSVHRGLLALLDGPLRADTRFPSIDAEGISYVAVRAWQRLWLAFEVGDGSRLAARIDAWMSTSATQAAAFTATALARLIDGDLDAGRVAVAAGAALAPGVEVFDHAQVGLAVEMAAALEVDPGPWVRDRLAAEEGTILVQSTGTVALGATARFRGLVALVDGEPDRAGDLLRQAAEHEEPLRSDPMRARTAYWTAVALSRTGDRRDRDRALVLVGRVSALAAVTGQALLAGQTDDLQSRLLHA